MNDTLSQAIRYFRQEMGLSRLLDGFIEKYRTYQRLGGKVELKNLSESERAILALFLKKDLSKESTIRISFRQFEKAFEETKFEGIDVKGLLDGYHGKPIVSRQDEKDAYTEEKNQFFAGFLSLFSHSHCQYWIKKIIRSEKGTRQIHKVYEQNREGLGIILTNVCLALSEFPLKQYERLPLFAARITKDPHAFDFHREDEQGKILLNALQLLRHKEDDSYSVKPSLVAEEITELLHHFGVVRDDILNFVTCVGIMGYQEANVPMKTWQYGCEEKHVLNEPLREINKAKFFRPYQSNKLFIVENSGLFSAILDRFEGDDYPPLICTHGQFKLASLVLLEKLSREDIEIYYSGDFDPEGLLMVQRLMNRYPNHVYLWGYGVNNYIRCLSSNPLSSRRLNQLKNVVHPKLIPIKHAMEKEKRSGYQEHLIDFLISDLNAKLKRKETRDDFSLEEEA